MRQLVAAAIQVPGVEGAGCLLMHGDGAVQSVAPTGPAAAALESAEVLAVEGPCHEAFLTGEFIHVPDMVEEERWPRFTAVTGFGPFRTILSAPIHHRGVPIGALDCFSVRPRQWGQDARDQIAGLAHRIGRAIEDVLDAGLDRGEDPLADELRAGVDQLAVITRATQVVADAIDVPAADASRRIRHFAASVGFTVVHMCEQVLERGALPSPQELGELADETRRLRDELTQMAMTDVLTGLANRSLLLDRTRHALDAVPRGGPPPAVIFIDLDRFKTINDSLGHDAGDQVLREVGHRLRSQVRAHDTVARLGGDEFAVLLEGADAAAEAGEVAARVVACLEEPIELTLHVGPGSPPRVQEIRTGASLGVAVAHDHDQAIDLLRDADLAMYHAKRDPQRRVQVFTAGLHELGRRRWRIETLLREALHGPIAGRPWLVYQPIIDIEDGQPVGVEALVRWSHPRLGDVNAQELIEAAEEGGLIVELGAWLLREACRQLEGWRGAGLDLYVAANVSAQQLVDPNFVAIVRTALAEHGVEPSGLHLEVTETQLLYDPLEGGGAAATLFELADIGVSISLDDFGTGFSSLVHVVRLPVSTLKVDRTFVQYLPDVHDSRSGRHATAIVAGIVAGGAALDMSVVAEGVETVEQHNRVVALGCRLAQGYLYARPALPEHLDEQLRTRWAGSSRAS